MLLERVVLGTSLESITYAFLNDCYFLPIIEYSPMFFDISTMNLFGNRRIDYSWSRLQTIMALNGKLLSIRVSEGEIKISSFQGLNKYQFELCQIFETTGLQLENDIVSSAQPLFLVYDDFELSNLGGKHEYLQPKSEPTNFAGKIYYYTSNRVDGAHYVTDCVSESTLSREQLNDFEYSDSMVRFAVERHLTSIGIYGNFMEYYKNGNPKYRKPKVVHSSRTVREIEKTIYRDSERVKFLEMNLKEIFNEASTTRP